MNKSMVYWTVIAAMTLAPCAAFGADEQKPAETVELKNDVDKFSYAIGVNIGKSLKRDKIDLNKAVFSQAIQDVLDGKTLALTDEQLQQTIMEFQKNLMAKKQETDKQAGEKNVTEGKAFLEANAKKEGVKVLPSGLQYKVIKEGDGPTPKATDKVKTNYKGSLIDGTVFDASSKHGDGGPSSFGVGQVIKGWTEALQLMKVGSKWQLFVPSELAYGARGAGGDIGPNATLVFEIELLGIEQPAAPANADAGTLIK